VVRGPWSVARGPWSVVRGRWSVVGGRWSVVSGQWSVVSGQWSVVRLVRESLLAPKAARGRNRTADEARRAAKRHKRRMLFATFALLRGPSSGIHSFSAICAEAATEDSVPPRLVRESRPPLTPPNGVHGLAPPFPRILSPVLARRSGNPLGERNEAGVSFRHDHPPPCQYRYNSSCILMGWRVNW
jgi:hypothetical protein